MPESTPEQTDTSTSADVNADGSPIYDNGDITADAQETEVESETETPAENSEETEQPEPSEEPDDNQSQTEPKAAPVAEPSKEDDAKLHAARKITELGQKAADLERQLAAERSAIDSFVRRDAEAVAADPRNFQRLLNGAKTQEELQYIDKVYQALPPIHRNAAAQQMEEWKQLQLEGETEEQRITRVASEIAAKELAPIREDYQRRQAAEQEARLAKGTKELSDFCERHNLGEEELNTLASRMNPVFAALRQSNADVPDADLLDRALAAVDPERFVASARSKALLEESDRRAGKMMSHGAPSTTPRKTVTITDEHARLTSIVNRITGTNDTPESIYSS